VKWWSGEWNNEGLVLIALDEGVQNKRWFHSSEATANQILRPTLTITYETAPVNSPPIAAVGGPYFGETTIPILFDGTGSFDPEGQPLTYLWDFGDGATGTGPTPSHIYPNPGTYTVSLVVNDGGASSKPDTTSVLVGITLAGGGDTAPPRLTALLDPAPSPFRQETTIRYTLAAAGPVSLRIYDAQGRLVRVLAEGQQPPGSYRARWDGGQERGGRAARGVYFCRFAGGGVEATRKLILLD
jgi:hypothetical protein